MKRSNDFVIALGTALLLVGCGGPDKPAVPPPPPLPPASQVSTAPEPAPSPAAPAGDLSSQVKSSKLTLVQAIQQVEKDNGSAISAKFELEDGKLSLSVYAAKAGLDKDAEHNELIELSGDPTKDKWAPKTEVFEDKKHISRASMHLTLVARAKTALAAVVAKASARQAGTPISVTPVVKDKKPAFEVIIATADGKTVPVVVDGG